MEILWFIRSKILLRLEIPCSTQMPIQTDIHLILRYLTQINQKNGEKEKEKHGERRKKEGNNE